MAAQPGNTHLERTPTLKNGLKISSVTGCCAIAYQFDLCAIAAANESTLSQQPHFYIGYVRQPRTTFGKQFKLIMRNLRIHLR
jgi:hypothetical protein